MEKQSFSMVRPVPYMGVIWATNEASKLGYYNGHSDWCNLGQGQPEEDSFRVPADKFMGFIRQEKLDAFVFSNPCNSTGELVSGEDLRRYMDVARQENCLLGVDAFYSQFIYKEDGTPADAPVSALSYIEDIESDPIIVFDGLTKGFRYPGWPLLRSPAAPAAAAPHGCSSGIHNTVHERTHSP